MMQMLFLAFLATAAIQDLREKQVKLWVFFLFGLLSLGLAGYLWLKPGMAYSWQEHLKSSSLGLGLLGMGRICREEIGAGDGLFFLISGWQLSFQENLLLLCGGMILCGLYAMTVFVWYRIFCQKRVGKETIPFLPFVAVWGVWMTSAQLFS